MSIDLKRLQGLLQDSKSKPLISYTDSSTLRISLYQTDINDNPFKLDFVISLPINNRSRNIINKFNNEQKKISDLFTDKQDVMTITEKSPVEIKNGMSFNKGVILNKNFNKVFTKLYKETISNSNKVYGGEVTFTVLTPKDSTKDELGIDDIIVLKTFDTFHQLHNMTYYIPHKSDTIKLFDECIKITASKLKLGIKDIKTKVEKDYADQNICRMFGKPELTFTAKKISVYRNESKFTQ